MSQPLSLRAFAPAQRLEGKSKAAIQMTWDKIFPSLSQSRSRDPAGRPWIRVRKKPRKDCQAPPGEKC